MFPFTKKPNEKQMLTEERAYQHNESVIADANSPQNQDEMLKLQQEQERSDLIRWQQDLSEDAQAFVYDIMGFYQNEDDEWVRDKNATPLANMMFVRRIKPLLRLASSRNLMMTNYSDERVRRSLQRAASRYADLIYFHWKTFNINKRDCSYLVEAYQELIEPTHYRSLMNGERKYLTTINKRIETFSDRPEKEKKGIFGV